MYRYIYKVTNTVNGKIYIGQRTLQSKQDDFEYLGSGNLILLAVKKYGVKSFIKEILESDIISKLELDNKEKFWIEKFNSTNEEIGYNICLGGQGGFIKECDDEKRERMSKSLKGKVSWNKGLTKEIDSRLIPTSIAMSKRILSEESRKKISIGNTGKVISEEVREKMKLGHKQVEKFTCEFCQRSFNSSVYNRFHGIKCLEQPNLSTEQLEDLKQYRKNLTKHMNNGI